jgi:glycosyltransferase involved in cell wall biosynthesis
LGALSQISAFGLRILAPTLRRWDKIAASRPDHYIAISNRVARRIKKYYGQSSTVIYPPVSVQKFHPGKDAQNKGEYYLVVSRLVGYKRLDIIVQAFRELGLPLVIIGEGRQKAELQNNAAPTIRFIDRHLTDSELANYYQNCRAFIHVADEDFGISMVEAQACGKPVIAFKGSAAAEIIVPGKTGILFDRQTVASLRAAVTGSRRKRFDEVTCRTNALRFSSQAFKQAMMKSVQDLYEQHRETL